MSAKRYNSIMFIGFGVTMSGAGMLIGYYTGLKYESMLLRDSYTAAMMYGIAIHFMSIGLALIGLIAGIVAFILRPRPSSPPSKPVQ